MRIHSSWLEAYGSAVDVRSAAERMVAAPVEAGGDHRFIAPYGLAFADRRDTAWERSVVRGEWTTRIANVPLGRSDRRLNEPAWWLVGVAAPGRSLVVDVLTDLRAALQQRGIPHQPVTFPLSRLLNRDWSSAGIVPRSVRLDDGASQILVRAREGSPLDEHALRERLVSLGQIVGVTVEIGGRALAVLPDGAVVFSDPEPDDVVEAMSVLAITLR